MSDTLNVLRILQVVIVLLSVVVIYYATKGYGKTKSRSMLFLAIGFFFITIGAISAGLLFEFLNFNLTFVDTVEATCQVVGFLLIVYSILGTRD
jgi:hypothetical protein